MILIDSSVGSKELVRYPPLNNPSLACLADLSGHEGNRSSADISFAGKGPEGLLSIGIEFKSLSDLLSSIHSGRLQDTQIPTLKREYDRCWILYYGRYRCGQDDNLETLWTNPHNHRDYWKPYNFIGNRPMKYGYLESSLLSYTEAGICHKSVPTIEDAAKWIGCLYRWWQKDYDKHSSFRTFDRSSDLRKPAIMPGIDEHTRAKMEFADRIPGIDYKKSMSIAGHFDSIQDMVNAGVDEWMRVPGIGKVISKVAVEMFSRRGRVSSNNANKEEAKKAKGVKTATAPVLDLFR